MTIISLGVHPYGVRTYGSAPGRGLVIREEIEGGWWRGLKVPRYNRGNVDQVYQHTVPRASGDRATPSALRFIPRSPHASLNVEGVIILCVIMIHGLGPRSSPARSKARQPFHQLWRSLISQTYSTCLSTLANACLIVYLLIQF